MLKLMEKGLVTSNAHVKYESRIYNGSEVIAKIKVFVHAHDHTHSNAGTGGMAIPLWTLL